MDKELIGITLRVICRAGFGLDDLDLHEKRTYNGVSMTVMEALDVRLFVPVDEAVALF